MPQPHLDQETLKSILTYDPVTGEFTWRERSDVPNNWNRRYAGKVAGNVSKHPNRQYRSIGIFSWPWHAHRLAFLYMTGRWPSEIDHIDCNPLNNRWSNLRESTHSQNLANRKPTAGKPLKGAFFHKTKQKWKAQIKNGAKQVHLGYFASAQEAHAAYCVAAKNMFGEFSRF